MESSSMRRAPDNPVSRINTTFFHTPIDLTYASNPNAFRVSAASLYDFDDHTAILRATLGFLLFICQLLRRLSLRVSTVDQIADFSAVNERKRSCSDIRSSAITTNIDVMRARSCPKDLSNVAIRNDE